MWYNKGETKEEDIKKSQNNHIAEWQKVEVLI